MIIPSLPIDENKTRHPHSSSPLSSLYPLSEASSITLGLLVCLDFYLFHLHLQLGFVIHYESLRYKLGFLTSKLLDLYIFYYHFSSITLKYHISLDFQISVSSVAFFSVLFCSIPIFRGINRDVEGMVWVGIFWNVKHPYLHLPLDHSIFFFNQNAENYVIFAEGFFPTKLAEDL